MSKIISSPVGLTGKLPKQEIARVLNEFVGQCEQGLLKQKKTNSFFDPRKVKIKEPLKTDTVQLRKRDYCFETGTDFVSPKLRRLRK